MAEKLHPPTEDVLSLTGHIIERGDFDHSQAIAHLHSVCLDKQATPPYQEIKSLQELEDYLKEKIDYPVSWRSPHATTKAVFIIIHPPSGVNTSKGVRSFASVCHHNFNPYSMSFSKPEYSGPQLWVPRPKRSFSNRRAIPFFLFTRSDADPAVFQERSGIHLVEPGRPPYKDDIIFYHEPFITDDGWFGTDDGWPNHPPGNFPYVFVPITRKGEIAKGWQIFAVPTDQIQELPANLLPVKSTANHQEDGKQQAVNVSLETGNPIMDRYFNKAWIGSALLVAGMAGFLAANTLANKELETTRMVLKELWPHMATAFCCAPSLFPLATLIWALNRDSKS